MPTQSLSSLTADLRDRMRRVSDPGVPAGVRRASAQYGSPCQPDCPECQGYGWVRLDVPIGDPRFGKVQLCSHAALQRDFSRCGLDAADRLLDWSSVADKNNALAAAGVVRDALLAGRGWVYLWGRPGLAKTLLLKVAVAEALRLGREAAFVQASDLLANLRLAFDTENSNQEVVARFDYWAGLPVLALDELDKISTSSAWVREIRFSLLNRRYEDGAKGKTFTLIASQTDPASLPEELASRINDGRFAVVRVQGDDVRPEEYWWERGG